MTNHKKRKTLIDRDDVRSDYCCSFVRGVQGNVDDDDSNGNLVTSQRPTSEFVLNLDGLQAKEFYESLFKEPSSSSSSTTKQTNSSSSTQVRNTTFDTRCSTHDEPSSPRDENRKRHSEERYKSSRSPSLCRTTTISTKSKDQNGNPMSNQLISNKQSSSRLKSYDLSYREKLYTISASNEIQSCSTYTNTSSRPIKIEDSDSDDDVMETEPLSDPHTRWRLTTNLLKLASQGNKKEIKTLLASIEGSSDFLDILNGSDSFGWTPLMCAAAENHLSVVKYLLRKGSSCREVENTGKSIFDICRQKENEEVLDILENFDRYESKRMRVRKEEEETVEHSNELVSCDVCGEGYLKSEEKSHFASTVHLFYDQSKEVGTSYSIPDHNKGFQMMLRSGWNLNEGLGPEGSGRKNPIKTKLKQDRLGLGVENDNNNKKKERVSHFSAFDRNAVKRNAGERVQKKNISKRTYERKRNKEKAWEQNMRRYMATDF